MNSDWMGRYSGLVSALVQHANVVSKLSGIKEDVGCGISLNANEWLTLIYIVEHRDNTLSMVDISRHLGIPQSSFSKLVKTLHGYGLADKYMAQNNRKVVIIRPTEKAVEIVANRTEEQDRERFRKFFEALEGVPDEYIGIMAGAITILNDTLDKSTETDNEIVLIKKD